MSITDILQPDYIAIVAILIGVGKIFKLSPNTKDKRIPILVVLVGIVLGVLKAIAMANGNWSYAVIDAGVTQGALAGIFAVFGNQVFKQFQKNE